MDSHPVSGLARVSDGSGVPTYDVLYDLITSVVFIVGQVFETVLHVDTWRDEILDPVVGKNLSFTSNVAPKQIQGYILNYGNFIEAAWKHPSTLGVISKIARIELVLRVD
ncbi:hypothetical protein BJ878DRAFT_576580 [Calycina marina]|uniref:Uncharacterized protein n=1 Tax=Calycina marina TaxID=1763456 RepID=A0A9P7Z208_9HELO|nr:hypothetical protein BJ878DRAFT_576580 [Calycina marina]